MEASDVSRLRELERENAELKKMFAEMSLENRAMKNLIEKSCNAQVKRGSCWFLVKEEQLSNRKACELIGISRTSYQYKSKLKDDAALQAALTDLTTKHVAIGFGSAVIDCGIAAIAGITKEFTECTPIWI